MVCGGRKPRRSSQRKVVPVLFVSWVQVSNHWYRLTGLAGCWYVTNDALKFVAESHVFFNFRSARRENVHASRRQNAEKRDEFYRRIRRAGGRW